MSTSPFVNSTKVLIMSIPEEIHLPPLNDTWKSIEESDSSDDDDDDDYKDEVNRIDKAASEITQQQQAVLSTEKQLAFIKMWRQNWLLFRLK